MSFTQGGDPYKKLGIGSYKPEDKPLFKFSKYFVLPFNDYSKGPANIENYQTIIISKSRGVGKSHLAKKLTERATKLGYKVWNLNKEEILTKN